MKKFLIILLGIICGVGMYYAMINYIDYKFETLDDKYITVSEYNDVIDLLNNHNKQIESLHTLINKNGSNKNKSNRKPKVTTQNQNDGLNVNSNSFLTYEKATPKNFAIYVYDYFIVTKYSIGKLNDTTNVCIGKLKYKDYDCVALIDNNFSHFNNEEIEIEEGHVKQIGIMNYNGKRIPVIKIC
jgi:hypothetical protein